VVEHVVDQARVVVEEQAEVLGAAPTLEGVAEEAAGAETQRVVAARPLAFGARPVPRPAFGRARVEALAERLPIAARLDGEVEPLRHVGGGVVLPDALRDAQFVADDLGVALVGKHAGLEGRHHRVG